MIRKHSLITCALGVAVLSLSLITPACTKNSPANLSAPAASQPSPYSEAAIRQLTNRVAEWQITHFDDFDTWVPTFQQRTRDEETGWIKGTFYKGLADWAAQSGNDDYYEFLKRKADAVGYAFGPRDYHADDHVVGQYYMILFDRYQDPAMLAPARAVYDHIIANPSDVSLDFGPEGTEEGYYKACLKRWCWADALFMSPPVLTKLTALTGDPKYLEFSDAEYWVATDYLFDETDALFLRDSRFFDRREDNGEKIYWSRGNGWVFSGLTDILDALPDDYPSRARYETLFTDMAGALISTQADSGFWPVSLKAGELYPVNESSGTAFFVAGLAWGIRTGRLDADTYLPVARKGWDAITRAVREDGMIGYVQQVGYAPDKVSADETQFYGAGAVLLAGTEMLALAEAGMIQ